MFKPEDIELLESKIEWEGFEYAFENYFSDDELEKIDRHLAFLVKELTAKRENLENYLRENGVELP